MDRIRGLNTLANSPQADKALGAFMSTDERMNGAAREPSPRFTLTQLFMGTALAAILLAFSQSEGCGPRYDAVECLSFSADGSRILVSRLHAQDAGVRFKAYMTNVSRTLSLLDAESGATVQVVQRDIKRGDQGPARDLFRTGRTSAVINPANGHVIAHDFGGGDLTEYVPDGAPLVTTLPHPALNIAISNSGRYVAASDEAEFTVVDMTTRQRVMTAAAGEPGFDSLSLAFSLDESSILTADWTGVCVWNIQSGKKTATAISGRESPSDAIVAAPDDTVVVSNREGVRLYDYSGKVLSALSDSHFRGACCISNDGRKVAIVKDMYVTIHDLASCTNATFLVNGFWTAAAFSPDGRSLALGDRHNNVALIDVHTGELRWRAAPPNRFRWPWTWPAYCLLVWWVVAWRLMKKPSEEAPALRCGGSSKARRP